MLVLNNMTFFAVWSNLYCLVIGVSWTSVSCFYLHTNPKKQVPIAGSLTQWVGTCRSTLSLFVFETTSAHLVGVRLAGVSLRDCAVVPVGVRAAHLVGEERDLDGLAVALIAARLDEQDLRVLVLGQPTR